MIRAYLDLVISLFSPLVGDEKKEKEGSMDEGSLK